MKIIKGIKKYISAVMIFIFCLSAASCGIREEKAASPEAAFLCPDERRAC